MCDPADVPSILQQAMTGASFVVLIGLGWYLAFPWLVRRTEAAGQALGRLLNTDRPAIWK